jgi:hypothetical protein
MKIFTAILMAAVLLTSVFIAPAAAETPEDSYLFTLGSKRPQTLDGYSTPISLTQEGLKDILGKNADFEQIAALLRAGSALDLLGYMGKHGVKEQRAYTITQYALDILIGTRSHTSVTKNLTSNEKKYLAAVLKAGYDKTPVPAAVRVVGASYAVKEDSYGEYASDVMKIESVMGGIVRINDLPEGVKVYTLSGDEAPYLRSGQSFYFKSSQPFNMGIYTAEHIYHLPEIAVYYHKNGEFSPLVTAIIGAENTTRDTVTLSFVPNPDTGDKAISVNVLYFTAALSAVLFCIEVHRRRKNLKIGRIGGKKLTVKV